MAPRARTHRGVPREGAEGGTFPAFGVSRAAQRPLRAALCRGTSRAKREESLRDGGRSAQVDEASGRGGGRDGARGDQPAVSSALARRVRARGRRGFERVRSSPSRCTSPPSSYSRRRSRRWPRATPRRRRWRAPRVSSSCGNKWRRNSAVRRRAGGRAIETSSRADEAAAEDRGRDRNPRRRRRLSPIPSAPPNRWTSGSALANAAAIATAGAASTRRDPRVRRVRCFPVSAIARRLDPRRRRRPRRGPFPRW